MGRKRKPNGEDEVQEDHKSNGKTEREEESDASSSPPRERKHYDLHPEIKDLARTFNIDAGLTQRLNDIMMDQRKKTWKQDLERLHEILKEAHTPAAMLNLKVKDMEKGTFVGKAKCGPRVREIARKHRLDKGATMKLEEAMAMREAMGKDVERDISMLDEHLSASNKPSALISMKLDSLRKGFNVGHCIYNREPVVGNVGPGVDGVVEKRGKGDKPLGYTDADLSRRFADPVGGGGGQLMDEATVRKMMAADRRRHQAAKEEDADDEEDGRKKPKGGGPSRSRGVDNDLERNSDRDNTKDRGRSGDRRRRQDNEINSRDRAREKDKDHRDKSKDRGKDKDKDKDNVSHSRGRDKSKDGTKAKSRSNKRSSPSRSRRRSSRKRSPSRKEHRKRSKSSCSSSSRVDKTQLRKKKS